ncbi:CHAT domain-containing protein [Polyangium spumosum]|nr:CHAT domain-containing protein [Polyangium spumosum]
MNKAPYEPQDLQVFLSRPPGTAPSMAAALPRIVVSGRTRIAPAPVGAGSTSTTDEQFPHYVAVANSEAVETIQLPFSPGDLLSFLRRLAGGELSIHDCVEFGAGLFDAVFTRSIRDHLRSLASKGKPLRLTIATSTPELLMIPWELLCDTQFGVLPQFLCQRSDIRTCRSLRLFNRADFAHKSLSDDAALRILLVTASPSELPPLEDEKEESMLRFVVDEAPVVHGVELQVLHNATVNELRRKLTSFRPHIVHVSCHGAFNPREGLGALALCSELDRTKMDVVNSFRLASLIDEPKSVRLVFLSTCHGAAQDPIETFSGLAECLHSNGVDAVAALQFELLDTTGHAVALNFYRHLLRERLTVEESVTRVRQYLFLNNHMLKECFGLVLFQSNCSLSWSKDGHRPRSVSGESRPLDDTEYVKAFEDWGKRKMQEKLSSILDTLLSPYVELESMAPGDVALMLNVFGSAEVGSKVIRTVREARIPVTPFLKIAKLASEMCHATHERQQLKTSLVLFARDDPAEYDNHPVIKRSESLPPGFFFGEMKKFVGEAIKVNGTDRAFVAIARPTATDIESEHIGSLKDMDVHSAAVFILGDPKWAGVFSATSKRGCAFIIPERSRIKLVVAGEQVGEYRQGNWSFSNFAELRRVLSDLAIGTSIDERVLLDVMQKAMVASDLSKGHIFVIRQKDGAEPRLNPGYKNIAESDTHELKDKPVASVSPYEYLGLVEGDGAVILSHDGRTLAIGAKLAPSPDTQVLALSAGTRHLSAQKITKESATVAIVVSDDGPVTIFHEGEVRFRKT